MIPNAEQNIFTRVLDNQIKHLAKTTLLSPLF